MKFPILGLIRLASLLSLGLTTAAVGLGRWTPPPTPTSVPVPVRYVGLGSRGCWEGNGSATLLNLGSKKVESLPIEALNLFDNASVSPWNDARGRVQVAGRWAQFSHGFIARDFGLARLVLPEGKILDHVATGILPVSAPCWYPGDAPRVLFAAGDGSLYHYRFADVDGRGADVSPRRLDWGTSLSRDGAHAFDPDWSSDPALGGRLLLGISELNLEDQYRCMPSALWWMQLNEAGTAVTKLGRLIRQDPKSELDAPAEERFPTVGRIAGSSSPCLAYLVRHDGEVEYRLRIAPLRRDEATGAPYAEASEARELAQHCGPVAPHFGLDGRELVYLPSRSIKAQGEPGAEAPVFVPISPAPEAR